MNQVISRLGYEWSLAGSLSVSWSRSGSLSRAGSGEGLGAWSW